MLKIENVSIHFASDQKVQAVEDFSLNVEKGEKVAIVGETGSGKSVLLAAILRLLPKEAEVSGQVFLNGENIFEVDTKRLNQIRGGMMSYIPQGGGASFNPLYTIGFQVGEPLREHRGYSKKMSFLSSIPLLKKFNFGNEERIASSYPHMLSGGMRQRAMVAMGIAAGAKMIFADEPTKGLDQKRIQLVTKALNYLEEEALLCVTHDLKFAAEIAKKICVMYSAQQVEYGTALEIIQNPLHPYTEAMISAMPENGMKLTMGFHKSGDGTEDGCRFYARCGYAGEQCKKRPPEIMMGNRMVRCWKYAVGNEKIDPKV